MHAYPNKKTLNKHKFVDDVIVCNHYTSGQECCHVQNMLLVILFT